MNSIDSSSLTNNKNVFTEIVFIWSEISLFKDIHENYMNYPKQNMVSRMVSPLFVSVDHKGPKTQAGRAGTKQQSYWLRWSDARWPGVCVPAPVARWLSTVKHVWGGHQWSWYPRCPHHQLSHPRHHNPLLTIRYARVQSPILLHYYVQICVHQVGGDGGD